MRTWLATFCLIALTPLTHAADLRFFNDATLHSVHFMEDGLVGWAVGDEGAVWHTIDAGKTWERQPTGVRASLRSLHFFNSLVGWVVGREELPFGAGSVGVLLYTNDGGERWQRKGFNVLPGLNALRFLDTKTGYVVGDGTDQHPSGVFMTEDSGRTWKVVPGPRSPGWHAAAFSSKDQGSLVGPWNRLASVRRGQVVPAVVDSLGGRAVKAIHLGQGKGSRTVAVGQGGLILLSEDGGASWDDPEIKLPEAVIACWDLHAIHGSGKKIWAAGRPGSVLLHSPDAGLTWEMQRTGQPLPIHGLHFKDDKLGWAVGELGLILHTADGGQSWQVQQQGGKRAALLLVHARATSLPLDTISRISDDGLLSAALRVAGPDPASAPFRRAGEADRLAAALRLAGGAAGEQLWQMPLPEYLNQEERKALLKHWDGLHGGNSGEQVLRQLVLAIRIWRPDVIVCDQPDAKGVPLDSLIGEGMREAFKRAGDPAMFPEQLTALGLKAWRPAKLYAPSAQETSATLTLNLAEVRTRLEASARDFAAPGAGLLAGEAVVLPRKRVFQLLASNLPGAEAHRTLFEGIEPKALSDARRELPPLKALSPELHKAMQARANLEALTEQAVGNITTPDRMLAAAGAMLEKMPDTQAAPAAHALASQYVRLGQWHLAREAFLLMTERYPAHPLTADAYRWLIKHNASSETRRRHELGQFLVTQKLTFTPPKELPFDVRMPTPKDGRKTTPIDKAPPAPTIDPSRPDWKAEQQVTMIRDKDDVLRWHKGALNLEPRLAGFGPVLANDPSLQFCLHAARRNLGDFETPRQWCSEFLARQPAGAWRDAAAAELWLSNRQGNPPRPLLVAQQTETRPFLDGVFDDACWKDRAPVLLRDARTVEKGKGDDLAKQYLTKVWMSYDSDFLYLALRCEHPRGHRSEPVKGRQRDADLKNYDRVSLLLDLDRDYATAFQFDVDQRGCVRESCWGDVSWNPRWFAAVHSDEDAWQIEAALPLISLTGDIITTGRAWACNVVRTLPGKGVQAFSLPAGVPEEGPRLEGLGLLLFKLDPRLEAQRRSPGQMKRVPE